MPLSAPDTAITPTGLVDDVCAAIRMQRFLLWMEGNGATFPSITVDTASGRRTIRTTRPVTTGELVLHIPRTLMITPELARNSPIGRMLRQGPSPLEDYAYIAAFLLQEKRAGGFWQPWLDVLPADFSYHPLFWNAAEEDEMRGSHMLPVMRARREQLEREYAYIAGCLPSHMLFGADEFAWAKCAVATRAFGATVDGRASSAMVPLADLLDHTSDREVSWAGTSVYGFMVTAHREFAAGEPVHACYGSLPDNAFLMAYGFCLPGNPLRCAEIELDAITAPHAVAELANTVGIGRGAKRAFRVHHEYRQADDMLGYLRLAHADSLPASVAVTRSLQGQRIAPLGRANEIAAMEALATACECRLRQYPTSFDEDRQLLAQPDISLNLRNATIARHGEKLVLYYFRHMAHTALPLLRDSSADLAAHATPEQPFADYFTDLIAHLGAPAA